MKIGIIVFLFALSSQAAEMSINEAKEKLEQVQGKQIKTRQDIIDARIAMQAVIKKIFDH